MSFIYKSCNLRPVEKIEKSTFPYFVFFRELQLLHLHLPFVVLSPILCLVYVDEHVRLGQRSTFNRTTKRANNARCYIRRKRAELYNEYIDVGQRSPGRTSRASAWNKDGTEGWIATDCSKMAAPSDREWDCHVGDRNVGSLPNKLNRTTICMYNVARTPPVPLMTRSYINRSPLDASIKIKYWPAFWIKYASLLSRSSTRKLRNIGRNLIKHWN